MDSFYLNLQLPTPLYDQLMDAGSPSERLVIACREGLRAAGDKPLPRENLHGRLQPGEGSTGLRWACPADVYGRVPDLEGRGRTHLVAWLRAYFERQGRIGKRPATTPPLPAVPEMQRVSAVCCVDEVRQWQRTLGCKLSSAIVADALRSYQSIPKSVEMPVIPTNHQGDTACAELVFSIPRGLIAATEGAQQGEWLRAAIRAFVRRRAEKQDG
jgi:hypothetical protein